MMIHLLSLPQRIIATVASLNAPIGSLHTNDVDFSTRDTLHRDNRSTCTFSCQIASKGAEPS